MFEGIEETWKNLVPPLGNFASTLHFFQPVVVLVIIGGVLFLTPKNQNRGATTDTMKTQPTQAASDTTTSADQMQKTYAMPDIETHNTEASCWSVVNDKVYDLTSWINQHPGGPEKITLICGIDGSAAFNGQHGEQPEPEEMLQEFYIGDLK